VSVSSIQSAAATSKWAFIRDGLGRGEQSMESRGAIFNESSQLYEASGALGAGPVSTKVRMRNAQAPIVKEAHDDYVAALLERGAIGFVGLVLLIGSLAVRSFSFSTGNLSRGFDRVVAKPHALAGAVAGTFAAAALYEVLHLRHVWALFAFVAAVSIWGRE
jgi:O-antigen ligase